jgi:hypothetical protein
MLGGVYYVLYMALLISKRFFRLGPNDTLFALCHFRAPKSLDFRALPLKKYGPASKSHAI